MKRWMIFVSFFLSMPAVAEECILKKLDGIWKNGHNVYFKLEATGCYSLRVTDVGSGGIYDFDYRFPTVLEFGQAWDGAIKVEARDFEVYGDYPWISCNLKWNAVPGFIVPTPAITVGFGMHILKSEHSREYDILEPRFWSFNTRKGPPGNFFDETLDLIARFMNRIQLGELITPGFQKYNTLRRVR